MKRIIVKCTQTGPHAFNTYCFFFFITEVSFFFSLLFPFFSPRALFYSSFPYFFFALTDFYSYSRFDFPLYHGLSLFFLLLLLSLPRVSLSSSIFLIPFFTMGFHSSSLSLISFFTTGLIFFFPSIIYFLSTGLHSSSLSYFFLTSAEETVLSTHPTTRKRGPNKDSGHSKRQLERRLATPLVSSHCHPNFALEPHLLFLPPSTPGGNDDWLCSTCI